MNKRIKLLDQQAVDYANNVCDANGIYKGKEYLTVVKEKFAELIVRECARVNRNAIESMNKISGKESDNTSFWLEEALKEHFRVEEDE